MTKKKVLVTGGAGYIGAHTLVELIQSGFDPVVIDDFSKSDSTLLDGIEKTLGTRVNFYKGNCLDKEFLERVFRKEETVSAVIHFAAYKSVGESVANPLVYYRNNIDSLLSILEVMQHFKIKDLIFSSSCTVYGQPDHIPVNEKAFFKRAESPYGATKQMGERILEDAFSTGFKIISLRYFNPIGAHPSGNLGELSTGIPNNLVPLITQTAIGKRAQLVIHGNDYETPDGTCLRDFIHVMDLASAHVKALEYLEKQDSANFYDVFNVGTGIGVSVLKLINEFEKVSGLKLNYTIGPRRPGDVEKTYADPTKAIKALGWKATFSISEALHHSWNWEQKLVALTDK
jgi:UDP-glucose-4-epimerase